MSKTDHRTAIGENIHYRKLACGLRLVILPKPNFTRKAATLCVPFGSATSKVRLGDRSEIVTFPVGTAHFLEHMLFESERDNITRRFTMLGATVNAYTTYNRTAVYFSTTNGLIEALTVLFDMIAGAAFTASGIAKEKAIIGKEIDLYRDDFEQQMYYDLLDVMYRDNPIKNDIAGDERSLAEIDKDILDLAFKAYYHPENMLLVLSGNIDIAQVEARIANHPLFHPDKPFLGPRKITEMDAFAPNPDRERVLDLKTDLILMGIKLTPDAGMSEQELALAEIKHALLLDNVFGKTADTFRNLQERNVVNNAFDFSVTCDSAFGHAMLFAESKKIDTTIKALRDVLASLPEIPVVAMNFEVQKRKIIGNFIQIFDSVSRANAILTDHYARDVDVFSLIESIGRLEPADIEPLRQELAAGPVSVVRYVRKPRQK